MSQLDAIKAKLATSAEGWGAVIDGVLNVRTVSHTKSAAATNALYLHGFVAPCAKPESEECDCQIKVLARLCPTVRLVAVSITVKPVQEGGAA